MKRILFLTAIFCLLAISAFAQKTDFSGNWTLDASNSKLDERARIESMTMNVTQTDKDIKVETVTKRLPPPDGAGQGSGGQGGGMGRGGFGGDGTTTYNLDGKESVIEVDGPMGKMPVKLKAGFEQDGKLKLSSSRTFNTQMGEISMTTNETWTLSKEGQTLTVKRDTESPRGTNSSELVFKKK